MEFRQLEYAVAVAEERNFTRAAARCHVTQPSLSVQVKKLERELGGPLFDRLGRRVGITTLGERFLPHARAILLRARAAQAAAHEVLEVIEGTVRLGVIPTIAPFWLPRVLPGLRRKLPTVQILLRESTTDVLIRNLQEGEIDYALAAMPFDIPDLHVETLFEEEFLLALRKDHPLTALEEIHVEEATATPWVLLMDMHCTTGQIVSFCHQRGRDVDTVFETSQVASQLGLVAAGLGISPIPRMAARPTPSVVYRRFRAPRPVREIVLLSHPDHFLTPAARAVAAACVAKAGRRPPGAPPWPA